MLCCGHRDNNHTRLCPPRMSSGQYPPAINNLHNSSLQSHADHLKPHDTKASGRSAVLCTLTAATPTLIVTQAEGCTIQTRHGTVMAHDGSRSKAHNTPDTITLTKCTVDAGCWLSEGLQVAHAAVQPPSTVAGLSSHWTVVKRVVHALRCRTPSCD